MKLITKRLWMIVGIILVIPLIFDKKKLSASTNRITDALFNRQWGLYNDGKEMGSYVGIDIGIKDVWFRKSVERRDVIVAVIDTGVDTSHEDLKDVFWVNKGEIPNNGIDDDRNGYIDDINGWNFVSNNNILYENEYDKHSTHVTGIIAANHNELGIAGISGNANVKIMVLKVLGGKEEVGFTYAIRDAIRYAEKNGASICNLSFGTLKSDSYISDAILSSKMLFITAAGNGDKSRRGYNIDENPIFPASYDYENIITVANLMSNGNLNPISNYGSKSVHLAAPGTKIYSTIDWTTYRNRIQVEPYSYMSGTSMAAPMVTGVAALLYSEFPKLSLMEVKEAILKGVRKLDTLQNLVSSGGMLSAIGSFQYCENVLLPRKLVKDTSGEGEEDIDLLNDKGSPPVIKIEIGKDKKYRIVFFDKDKDVWKIRYANGNKNLSYFRNGKTGNIFKSVKGKVKGLTYKKGKTYTIFVIDKKRNQTLKRIKMK